MLPSLLQMTPGFKGARGYITGYDTDQTPFEAAKERGLAGVLGGTVDAVTGGMTDFDKRGDAKKQKDVKNFLNKFVYGTQGNTARQTRDELGGGDITSFSPGAAPGQFNYSFDASEKAKQKDLERAMAANQFRNNMI